MNRLTTALFTLLLAASATGCVKRTVARFEDNQKAPVTALEVRKITSYWIFGRKEVHQFYMCQDTGSQLVCKLSCDGTNDVECPAAAGNGNTVTSSNIR
jgi:hypothetical protein